MSAVPDAGRVAAYRAAGIHSALIVPLTARGHDVGAVSMVGAGGSARPSHYRAL